MDPVVSEADAEQSAGPLSKLLGSLGDLLASLIEIGHTRLELLTNEVQEEVRRTAGLLTLAFVTLFAAGLGLLFAGLSVIFAYWDTHRILVSLLVTASFFAIAAVTGGMLAQMLRDKPRLLADTLAELEKDRDQLSRHL